MFHELAGGWADLILPATAALERDGTSMNLEGRVQRVRRAVLPPCPDELAWISKLAARFDVELPAACGGRVRRAGRARSSATSHSRTSGSTRRFPARHAYVAPDPATTPAPTPTRHRQRLRLQRYRPLFSGPAVERVPELGFQRPHPRGRAVRCRGRRSLAASRAVTPSSSARTARSVELRARVTGSSSRESYAWPRSTPATCHPEVEVGQER